MNLRAVVVSLRTKLAGPDSTFLTVVASWGARLIAVCSQLVTIPILARSLGNESYSLYVVLINLVAWYALADLGSGYSLQNGISRSRANSTPYADDIVSTVRNISLLLPVLLVVVAMLAPAITHLIWNPPPQQPVSVSHLVAVAGVIFSITALGNIGYRVLYADQQGWLANILQGLASFLSLALVTAGTTLDLIDTDKLLLAALMANSIPQASVALTALVIVLRRAIRAGGRLQDGFFIQNIRTSVGFLSFGILSLLTLQVDYFVLTRTVEPAQIVQYNVISKTLGISLVLFQAVLQAHWPHAAEAASQGDWQSVNARLSKLLRQGASLVLICAFGYAILERPLMRIISPQTPAALGPVAVSLYALYLLMRIWSDTHAMVLQSIGRMRIFLVYVPVQAALSLGLQVAGARAWGVSGLIAGLTLSFVLSSAWVLPVYLRHLQRT